MVFTANSVDLTPYIKMDGFKWSRYDIDGDNAGRSMQDADMVRDRIGTKWKFEVEFAPMPLTDLSTIMTALSGETFSLSFTSPLTGQTTAGTFYTNNISGQYLFNKGGIDWWQGFSAPFVEV